MGRMIVDGRKRFLELAVEPLIGVAAPVDPPREMQDDLAKCPVKTPNPSESIGRPTLPSVVTRLRGVFRPAEPSPSRRCLWGCFTLALIYAAGCAVLALHQSLSSPYAFADDAREHVFWMARYLDPALFPRDPIADYFQSLAPRGYSTLYWVLAKAGIAPLLASKLIPSFLSLIAVGYFFGLAFRVLRSLAGATLTAMLFAQCLWLNSDLASATPRAFFYPLFVAFLYYEIRGSFAGMLGAIILEALFFPPAALLSLGVLFWDNWCWRKGSLTLRRRPRGYFLLGIASVLTLLCLAPYWHQTSAFGPLVTYAQARQMPEFGPEGRVPYFFPSWWGRWIGGNGGIHNFPTRPLWFLAAFLWPLLRRYPELFPLLRVIPRGARPIPQVAAASLSLFAAAHLLFFHLYLPNRYTTAVMRVVLTLLVGGVLIALIDGTLRWLERSNPAWRRRVLPLMLVLIAAFLAYPLIIPRFPSGGYLTGDDPSLYRFFRQQPASIRIASLADEANNLPLLCQRSIIIGAECAVPFHPQYYLPLRSRGLQIARAQDSADPAIVQKCVRDQQIDFWLLDRAAFSRRYWVKSRLLRQLRLSAPGENLGESQDAAPLLQHPPAESIVYQDAHFLVLDAHRLFPRPSQRGNAR